MPRESSENMNDPELTDLKWLKDHIDDPDIRIVDTRPSDDYIKGHVKNSVNIGLSDMVKTRWGLPAMCVSEKDIKSLLEKKGIGNGTTVFVYDNFGGIFASRLLWTLEYFGHTNIMIFNGSIKRWIDSGEKFTSAIQKIKKARYTPTHDESRVATKEWILTHLNDENVKFLDVRTRNEYEGKTVYGTRGGHIPGAVNLHWIETIDPSTGRFRHAKDLKAMYEKIGIKQDNEIVTYCWMGLRASHTYAILRLLGYSKIRVYDGSWAEWGEINTLPVER